MPGAPPSWPPPNSGITTRHRGRPTPVLSEGGTLPASWRGVIGSSHEQLDRPVTSESLAGDLSRTSGKRLKLGIKRARDFERRLFGQGGWPRILRNTLVSFIMQA